MKLSDLSYWKNLRTSIIAVFLIIVLMAPMAFSDITAVDTYFEVSPKDNFVAGIGQEFTIDINIVDAPVNDTKAWEVTLEWSNSVLEITDVGEGTFLKGYSVEGTEFAVEDLDVAQLKGSIGIGCAIRGEPKDLPADAADLTGWLCNVTFEVLSCETCALNLKDTGLVDRAGERTDYPNNDGFFACAEVHDIAITDVTPAATSVQQGDVVTIDVTVHNGGNYTESGSVTVTAHPEDARSPVVSIDTSKPFTDLAEGNDVVLPFTWDTSGAAGEVYVLNATATVTGGDDDTHDNTYIGPKVRVISEDDVKITDVTVLTPEVSKGAPIANITVTVRNEGSNAEAIDVTLTANPGAYAVGTQSINLAGYDAETTLTFNWNTTLVPPTKANDWAPASPSSSITYTITATATITNATEATKNLNDNTLVDGTVTVAVHDAAVTGVKVLAVCNPSGFHPVVRVAANITNLGTEDIKVKVVLLATTDFATFLVCGLIPYIAASPSETVTVSSFSPYGGWNTKLLDLYGAAPPTPGSYYVAVKVYPIIGYTDDYPGNDLNYDPWTLPTVNHDVKVTDVTLLTPKVAKGDIAKINVTVCNQVFGLTAETVTVNIYGNDTLKNSTTVTLPPAEMITFMNATNFPNTNITVIESCGWYMYNLTLGGSPMGNVLFPANDTWWTIMWPGFLYDEVYTTTFHIDQGWWVNPYPVGPYRFHVDSVMKAGKEASIPGVTTSTPAGLPVVIAWKSSCKTVTVPWWTVGEALGEYTIKANATIVAGDDDPCDNARIDGKIKVVDHDVGVSIESVTTYMYLPVNVPVTVKNWGNYKENITVKVYIDYGNTTTKTITYDITNLEAGMSNTTEIFVRTAGDKPGFTWLALITVNATITTLGVTDADLSDNVLAESYVAFIEYIGDVDDSKYTDWFDMSMVGLAYESGPADPSWNPNCDFDGSNYIDWFDMSMLGLYYESGW